MKHKLVIIPSSLGLSLLLGGYYIPDEYWRSASINLSTGLLFFGLGIYIVNIYLERHTRSHAVRALLRMVNESIAAFHNRLLDLAWTRYSKEEFANLAVRYLKGNADIMSISPQDRQTLFSLFNENRAEITRLAANLEPILMEATSLAGWNLDPMILTRCLEARQSLRKLLQCDFEDRDDSRDSVVEHILDLDAHSQLARRKLLELAGIDEG